MIEDHAEKLISLVQIVEAGSIRRFAQQMRLSQPAASQRVASLERALGYEVLTRSQNGVFLTERGRILYELGKKILSQAREAEQKINLQSGQALTIHFGTYDSVAVYMLPKLMAQVQERHPYVEFKITCDRSQQLIAQVEQGKIDVALIPNPGSRRKEVETQIFFEDSYGFYISRHQQLDQRNLITLPDAKDGKQKTIGGYIRRFKIDDTHLIQAPSFEIAKAMTMAGLGVGILPHRVAHSGASGLRKIKFRKSTPEEFGPHPFGLIFQKSKKERLEQIQLGETLRSLAGNRSSSL